MVTLGVVVIATILRKPVTVTARLTYSVPATGKSMASYGFDLDVDGSFRLKTYLVATTGRRATLGAWLHRELMDFASGEVERMEPILPGFRRAFLFPGEWGKLRSMPEKPIEYERFEKLARAIISVPKRQITAERAKAARTKKQRRSAAKQQKA